MLHSTVWHIQDIQIEQNLWYSWTCMQSAWIDLLKGSNIVNRMMQVLFYYALTFILKIEIVTYYLHTDCKYGGRLGKCYITLRRNISLHLELDETSNYTWKCIDGVVIFHHPCLRRILEFFIARYTLISGENGYLLVRMCSPYRHGLVWLSNYLISEINCKNFK